MAAGWCYGLVCTAISSVSEIMVSAVSSFALFQISALHNIDVGSFSQNSTIHEIFFSFLFCVENSICHNLQAHSQYKTVLSSIRSIIHQCCESGTGKMFFWEIPMLTWKECWECVQKHVILQSSPMQACSYDPHFPVYTSSLISLLS